MPIVAAIQSRSRQIGLTLAGAATLTLAASLLVAGSPAGAADTGPIFICQTADVALNHPAVASSVEGPHYPASSAVDGTSNTRWSSAFSDPQWIQVDLGYARQICKVEINWERAYAKAFQIQASTDGITWTDLYSTTTGTGGRQSIDVRGWGRYLRVFATARATIYGDSIRDLVVRSGNLDFPPPGPTESDIIITPSPSTPIAQPSTVYPTTTAP